MERSVQNFDIPFRGRVKDVLLGVKISATYRFLAALLSVSIIAGISIPAGLHAMTEEVCETGIGEIHHSMSSHAEDCPMEMDDTHRMPKHHQAHDFGFACACSIDEAPLNIEVQAQLKVKAPVLAVTQILSADHFSETKNQSFQRSVSDNFSSPPIYLLNETFLK